MQLGIRTEGQTPIEPCRFGRENGRTEPLRAGGWGEHPQREELEKAVPGSGCECCPCLEHTPRSTVKVLRNDLAGDRHPQKVGQSQAEPEQSDCVRKQSKPNQTSKSPHSPKETRSPTHEYSKRPEADPKLLPCLLGNTQTTVTHRRKNENSDQVHPS